MHHLNDSERFNFQLDLVVDALKLKDKALVEYFENLLNTLLGTKYTTEIITAAVFHLSETDPDTCRWVLRNFYDSLHLEITEGVVMFAVQKLINTGFIIGQDFSATPNGGILIKKNALAALMEGTLASDHLFIEEISQVVD